MATPQPALSKAFGRSLPRDMREEQALQRTQVGLPPITQPTQLWKINDEKAGKNGPCQAVYWVKERPVTTEIKRSHTKPEKQWQTGTVYKGEWLSNKKHGYGTQIWANGNKYEGEWANGNREGHGVFWLKEKSASKPASSSSASSSAAAAAAASASPVSPTSPTTKKSSSATAVPKLRRVYAGNWMNDMKHGIGVYFYPDGSRYEGEWARDVRSGRGTLYSSNGDSYTGSWALDKQNGFGTLTKANKDVYEGEWVQGLREGSGIYYYKAQEKIYDGEWVADAPKCGVYCDAKEFFDDAKEEERYAAATGTAGGGVGEEGGELSEEQVRERLAAAAAQANPDMASPRVPRTLRSRKATPIPRLRMEDPDGVLASSIERTALDRAAVRNLPHVSLSDLFNDRSLDALRRMFAGYDHNLSTGDGSGKVSLAHLPAMLVELGMPEPDDVAFAQLCTDLGKPRGRKERMDFGEFVRAVHLREEARKRANQRQAEREQQQ